MAESKPTPNKYRFIFCSFFPVGLEDYVDFFKDYFNDFVYLKWKFPHSKDKSASSRLAAYRYGKEVRQKTLYSFSLAGTKLYFLFLPLNYLLYLLQALRYLFYQRRDKSEKVIFMGINYYCTFCGIVLKKLGRVDYVIYRVMDFFPLPPSGPYRFLNKIFYKFDQFCLKNSDSVWFTTEGHIIGREKQKYFDRAKSEYEIIPLALNKNKFVSHKITKQNAHSMVYCGVVSCYHMLDLVFDVIADLRKDIPDVKLNLIGSGPDLEYFEQVCRQKKLGASIKFWGYMAEDKKFADLMAENSLGIALYRDEENFMKYTEPAKVKYYLNFGVPALVSKVPRIALELDRKKVAFAVDNEKDEIVGVIKKYFADQTMQEKYKKNIQNYLPEIEVNALLLERMKRTLEKLHHSHN